MHHFMELLYHLTGLSNALAVKKNDIHLYPFGCGGSEFLDCGGKLCLTETSLTKACCACQNVALNCPELYES